MNVGKCQSVSTAYGASAGRVASGSSSFVGATSSNGATPVPPSEGTPAVLNQVDQSVYSAIDEFLCLSGDDRLDSYSNLPENGKKKFMKVVGKLVGSGEVDQSKLDLGEQTQAKESFLNDYVKYSDNTASPYSADGRILG